VWRKEVKDHACPGSSMSSATSWSDHSDKA
jgi:hypothetical protein